MFFIDFFKFFIIIYKENFSISDCEIMKLIKIEIEGFKSFAESVSIKFDGSIVGIIGPNGSGKSNINDAIK